MSAVLCAVCGLVLAASAMPMIASESPASEFVDRDSDERETETETAFEQDEHAMDVDGAGGPLDIDTELPNLPGGAVGDRPAESEHSIAETALYGLTALFSALDGDSSGDIAGDSGDEFASSGAEADTPGEGSSDDGNGADGRSDTESGADGHRDTESGESERSDSESHVDETTDEPTADADADGDDSSLEDAVPGLSDGVVMGGLVVGGLVALAYVFATRSNPTAAVLSIPGRLVSAALSGVVACSQALERAIGALYGLRSIAELPGLVAATLVGAFHRTGVRIRTVGSSLFGGRVDASTADAAGGHASARKRIGAAFESVIDAAPMSRERVATATPTDVARSARDAGAPDEPVETITHSFRDVEYGGRDPETHLERTTTAHDRLQSALEATESTETTPAADEAGGQEGETDE
ncbi:hypothetical protein [Natronorubrum sulfidifaciens]|nr:hypothetical protein [Natronorubrum sulfidifaciens]